MAKCCNGKALFVSFSFLSCYFSVNDLTGGAYWFPLFYVWGGFVSFFFLFLKSLLFITEEFSVSFLFHKRNRFPYFSNNAGTCFFSFMNKEVVSPFLRRNNLGIDVL